MSGAIRSSLDEAGVEIVADFAPDDPSNVPLQLQQFNEALALKPEIALLGTGAKQRFPHPRLYRALIDAGIGVEVMDSAAAARTYNIIAAEGRRVVAGLVLP